MANKYYIPRVRKTPKERLLSKISISNTGCWNWGGFIHPITGYGQFYMAHEPKNIRYAHRASYLIHFGEFDLDLLVCHHCDNRKCVNPDHLFLGTQSDNITDAQNKGRFTKATHPSRQSYRNGCRCQECKLLENTAQSAWRLANPEKYKAICKRSNARIKLLHLSNK